MTRFLPIVGETRAGPAGRAGGPAAAPALLRRRVFVGAAAALALPVSSLARAASPSREAAASSHFPMGPVVPARALDRWTVTTHQGQRAELASLLRGKVTALQLMFTGCSVSCPIQGALFSQAQQQLGTTLPVAQFVSLSIDALGDHPASLRAWLQRHGAAPGWQAVVPAPADVDAIVNRIGQGGDKRPAGSDPHVTQVYVFDPRAELVWRTAALPPPARIVEAVRQIAAASASTVPGARQRGAQL